MKQYHTGHLIYDDLLKAIVDPQELAQDRRRHFEHCPQCSRAAQRLEQRYMRLGRLASRMTPEPTHAFRVPRQARQVSRWQSRPALAMGLAGALILFVTMWWPLRFNPSQQPPKMAAVNTEQELELMRQVDVLVEDALPPVLQQLASVTESNTTEDLIEWVLPSIDEEEVVDPRAAAEATTAGPMLISSGHSFFRKRGGVC